MTADLIKRLYDEADQCRNDGATDIAGLLDEAAEALRRASVTVQVPREPTQLMCQAAQESLRSWPRFPFRVVSMWKAMLDAYAEQEEEATQ